MHRFSLANTVIQIWPGRINDTKKSFIYRSSGEPVLTWEIPNQGRSISREKRNSGLSGGGRMGGRCGGVSGGGDKLTATPGRCCSIHGNCDEDLLKAMMWCS